MKYREVAKKLASLWRVAEDRRWIPPEVVESLQQPHYNGARLGRRRSEAWNDPGGGPPTASFMGRVPERLGLDLIPWDSGNTRLIWIPGFPGFGLGIPGTLRKI
jgi:hypothetical protein